MYPQQRSADASYPSPSPSVPSPAPRSTGSPGIDPSIHSSTTATSPIDPPDSHNFVGRVGNLGPVRNTRYGLLPRLDPRQLRPEYFDLPDDEEGLGMPLWNDKYRRDDSRLADALQPYRAPSPYRCDMPGYDDDDRDEYDSRNDRQGSSSQGSRSAYPQQCSPDGREPPSGGQQKRSHIKSKLSNKMKHDICMWHLMHPAAKQEVIAAQFGIERSTVSKILKNKREWMEHKGTVEVPRNRNTKFPEVEKIMREWLQECLDNDRAITDASIRARALEAAQKSLTYNEDKDKFKASSGWIENFKHRNGVKGGKWTTGVKTSARVLTPPPPPSPSPPPRVPTPPVYVEPPPPLPVYHHPDPQSVIYQGVPAPKPAPTSTEAEEALDLVMEFLKKCPHDLVTEEQLEQMMKVKFILFRYGNREFFPLKQAQLVSM